MLIDAEIVYATADRQELIAVQVEAGTTVAEAIALSSLQSRFPGVPLDNCQTGIWGRIVPGSQVLRDGDRIELYRDLQNDPRDARRAREMAARN